MQKKFFFIGFVLLIKNGIQVKALYTKQDSAYKNFLWETPSC